ncbi:MAG: hypothetical protein EOP04_13690 [Proteobacteria bacterium]|nr:MAG: hypothetical protein EOP04_13690 [Pseudomonadota bacterium]
MLQFWGPAESSDCQADTYAGFGQLYVDDRRFTFIESQPGSGYALFMRRAMETSAEQRLN